MPEDLVAYCKRRYSELKADRCNFEDMWEDISRFIIPNRGAFNTKNSQGQKNRRFILDSAGDWACQQLANFLYGALTNPASRWFELGTYNSKIQNNYEARQYLTHATEHLYGIFNNPRKKFYDHCHEIYNDVVPFGTGVMFVEDRPGSGLTFKSRFLYECYLDEDYDGNVDIIHRCFEMTLRQIVQQFDEDSLPDELKRIIDKEPNRKFEVLHCICPNDSAYGSKVKKPYISNYMLLEKNHVLKEGGFNRFPVLAPRWSKRSDEIYGRGPGSMALAEVRMLQKMKEITIKGGQLAVLPSLEVVDNTFLSPLNLTPGAINARNPIFEGDAVKPIILDPRVDFGIEMMDRERDAIYRAFYVDKLSSQKGPNTEQTRTEFLGDQQERLMLMAPQLGRMHTELLGPLIEQTYLVERAAGRLEAPPAVLQGQALVVQYKSPLARAQQMQKLQDITGAVQDLVPLAQVFPEILDPIDPDGLAGWVFMAHDTPTDVLKPEDQVKQVREKRQQQQEMQASLEQAKLGSEAAKNVAQLSPRGQKSASV